MTRFTTRWLAVAAALLTSLVAPHATASARDYSFRPFTDLGSVCPTCPPPAGDVVALKSGQKLHGTVIAVNSAFYTLARFGEVRTIGRGEVAKVTWLRGSQPSGIDKLDQIIFKNGDVLTGRITPQSWGDICDGEQKRQTLLDVASLMGISPAQCIAVGDGSNDLPMMRAAGLSVAYHAKPRVRGEAKVAINAGGLDRLLSVVKP